MSPQVWNAFDQCAECDKEFRRVRISDPRKGYDVLQEDASGWEVRYKGCGETQPVPK